MMNALQQLTDDWNQYKANEQHFNRMRLKVEVEILKLVKGDLKEKGTNTLETGLKVVTDYTEKWDQEAITAIEWDSTLPFPFKTEYKPVKALLDIVKASDIPKYVQLQKALTLTPCKPSFSYKE